MAAGLPPPATGTSTPVGEAPDIDAEPLGLGVPLLPAGHAEDGIIHIGLGARRDRADDVLGPVERDRRLFALLNERDSLGDDLILELLPFSLTMTNWG